MKTKMSMEEIKKYYGKKYRPILKALEENKFSNFFIDTSCYGYIELECEKYGKRFSVNYGINNKYNVWYKSSYGDTKRNSFSAMKEVVNLIEEF